VRDDVFIVLLFSRLTYTGGFQRRIPSRLKKPFAFVHELLSGAVRIVSTYPSYRPATMMANRIVPTITCSTVSLSPAACSPGENS
jgi:hypothetical protein